MNRLEKDEDLRKIIEHAKALREECVAYNRKRDYSILSLTINDSWCAEKVFMNILNMPKENASSYVYKQSNSTHYHYKLEDIQDVEFYEVVDGGADNGKTV